MVWGDVCVCVKNASTGGTGVDEAGERERERDQRFRPVEEPRVSTDVECGMR